MFNKKAKGAKSATAKPTKSRDNIPTIITSDVHMLGNLVSDGAIDFSGTIDGNIRCDNLTLRECGTIKGEITANSVFIQGTVKGLIRAKNVNLLASCKVEGIIIHEQLAIEDGAFVDGKFKRSDRVAPAEEKTALKIPAIGDDVEDGDDGDNSGDTGGKQVSRSSGNVKVLENIRLIR